MTSYVDTGDVVTEQVPVGRLHVEGVWRVRMFLAGFLVILLAATGGGWAAAGTRYRVTATVPVGASPYGVAVDRATHTAYVADTGDGTVSVIDGSTDTVTATIQVGGSPLDVGVDPTTHTVYVAGYVGGGANTVSVIDGSTDTVTATIPIGLSPSGLAVDPTTHTVYVIADYSVSVIDGSTDTVTATVPVGSSPSGVGVDPTTDTVYVGNADDNTVSVIDGVTNAVTATVPVGGYPDEVAVDPTTHTVYVADYAADAVSVIDGSTNTVTATVPVGSAPSGLGVDPTTHTVYVAEYGADAVSVIDGTSNTVTATVPGADGPTGVGVDPTTHTAYVTDRDTGANTVSVIAAGASPTIWGTPPTATAGQADSFVFSVTGSPAPTVAVTAGTLPPGLTLSASGHLSGTPTVAGNYPFTVTATNGIDPDATDQVTLSVVPGAPAVIAATAGNGQSSPARAGFPTALAVTVTDHDSNPVAGAPVTFAVTATTGPGAGTAGLPTFPAGQRTATVTTDPAGVATAPTLTAGSAAGPVRVIASTPTLTAPITTAFLETVVAAEPSRADLAVTLTAPAVVERGTSFTATVTVANHGPSGTGPTLTTLALPPAITVDSPRGGGAGCVVVFWLPGLPSGASHTYIVTLTAVHPTRRPRSLVAAATSQTPDPHHDNNVASTSITVT